MCCPLTALGHLIWCLVRPCCKACCCVWGRFNIREATLRGSFFLLVGRQEKVVSKVTHSCLLCSPLGHTRHFWPCKRNSRKTSAFAFLDDVSVVCSPDRVNAIFVCDTRPVDPEAPLEPLRVVHPELTAGFAAHHDASPQMFSQRG